MGLKNNFIRFIVRMPVDSNENLPSGTTIGYIMVLLRLLFTMVNLPKSEYDAPWDFFEFRYSWKDLKIPRFRFGPTFLQRPIHDSSWGVTKPTIQHMESFLIVRKMRQRILQVANQYFESKNRLLATFDVLREFYPSINAIELFAWILLHSNLRCFKFNFPQKLENQIMKPPSYCSIYFGTEAESCSLNSENFNLQVLKDFQEISMKFPEEAKLYLEKLHQKCETNTARRIKAIINYCLINSKSLTQEINADLSAHYVELWRRVTFK